MGPETNPCMFLGWWLSPWELPGIWDNLYCCSSYGASMPFSFFSTIPNSSIEFLTSVQWLDVSMCICFSQRLVKLFSGQPCQTPVCKYKMASLIGLWFGGQPWDGSQLIQTLDGLSFTLCSSFVHEFLLGKNNSQ